MPRGNHTLRQYRADKYRSYLPALMSKKRAATAAAFVPTDIAGSLLWLDASDITTLWQDSGRTSQVSANGQSVGAWDDKSGNARHMTNGTAAEQPTYQTGIFGSLAAVSFDNGDRLLHTLAATTKPFSMFAVIKRNADTQEDAIFGSSASAGLEWRVDSTAHHQTILSDGTASIASGTGTILTTEKKILGVTYSGVGVYAFRMNGASDGTGTNDVALTSGQIRLGFSTGGGGNEFFSGHIAEFLFYDSVVSAGNITSIESYLNSKWAVY